jgi:hypothetical protein
MKKAGANLPDGVLGFRQPYGGIDHVEQWRELSGNNDSMIELQSPLEPPAQKQATGTEENRT